MSTVLARLESNVADLKRVLAESEGEQLEVHAAATDKPEVPATPVFAALRQWRTEQARAKAVPPYIIATDAMLRAIEEAKPTDIPSLGAVRGFGMTKATTYGADILQVMSKVAAA